MGLMVYSFARIGAALGMPVEDVYTQNRRLWVRLRDRGLAARDARATKISRNIFSPISTAQVSAMIPRARSSVRSGAVPTSSAGITFSIPCSASFCSMKSIELARGHGVQLDAPTRPIRRPA